MNKLPPQSHIFITVILHSFFKLAENTWKLILNLKDCLLIESLEHGVTGGLDGASSPQVREGSDLSENITI